MLFTLSDLLDSPVYEWTCLGLGLIVGSFANVCIHRVPFGLSVITPRSRCPHCNAGIRAWHNVPILGYLWLLGRCATCRAPIGVRYPAVEIANGLGWLAVAEVMGPTPRAFLAMPYFTALLVLAVIDFDHQLLPDVITIPGTLISLLASFLPGFPGPLPALLAAVAGYCGMAAVGEGWRLLRGQSGFGQGDWKMTAMLGAFLGWQAMLMTVFLATLAGTLVGVPLILFRGHSFQHKLPLGTFLGAAGIVMVLYGDALLAWYRGLMQV